MCCCEIEHLLQGHGKKETMHHKKMNYFMLMVYRGLHSILKVFEKKRFHLFYVKYFVGTEIGMNDPVSIIDNTCV